MRRRSSVFIFALISSAAVIVTSSEGRLAAVRYTATAVSLGGPRTPSGTAQLDIVIDRWSTDAERERLLAVLKKSDDQDELLRTLQNLEPVGHIRTPSTIGYDLRYANRAPGEDGGQRLFIATDRPIGFWEAANQPRSIQYPFTFIELRLSENGKGEGKLSLATRVLPSSNGKVIQLENYAAQPVMLTNVERQRP